MLNAQLNITQNKTAHYYKYYGHIETILFKLSQLSSNLSYAGPDWVIGRNPGRLLRKI